MAAPQMRPSAQSKGTKTHKVSPASVTVRLRSTPKPAIAATEAIVPWCDEARGTLLLPTQAERGHPLVDQELDEAS